MFNNQLKVVEKSPDFYYQLNKFEEDFKSFSGETSLRYQMRSDDLIKVSIICVTYNHVNFIERTLFGFLNQKFDEVVEILIFDDCSNDGTTEIIQEYEKKHPLLIKHFIQPYNKFSKGEAKPHLFFEMAKGKYVAYCEGDDFWLDNNKLKTQFEYLEKFTKVSLVYSSAVFVDQHNNLQDIYSSSSNYIDHSSYALETGVNIFTLTAMFRNKIHVMDVKGKNVYLDIILWSLCGEIGNGKYLPKNSLCAYRVHSSGLNSTASINKRLVMLHDTYSIIFVNKLKKMRLSSIQFFLKLILIKFRLIFLKECK